MGPEADGRQQEVDRSPEGQATSPAPEWPGSTSGRIKNLPVFATVGEELPGKSDVPKFNFAHLHQSLGDLLPKPSQKCLPVHLESLNGAK